MPALYATLSEAQEELDDTIRDYKADIKSGERDADDEYEGELLAVRWDGGDTLQFLDPTSLSEISSSSLRSACGW